MSQESIDAYMFDEGDKQVKFSDLFHLKSILGSGSFGTVVSALHKQKMKDYAIKVITKKHFAKTGLKDLFQEAAILNQLNHKNIVQFYKYIDTETKVFIVMELVEGGQLRTYLDQRHQNKDPLTEDEAAKLLLAILSAVEHFHTKDIVHRDLKPENILLQDTSDLSSVKVCDFGLSAQYDPDYTKLNFTDRCGTKIFMAPEQVEKKAYSKPVDLWSCGIIMYMLLNNGRHPVFTGEENFDTYKEKLLQMNTESIEGLKNPLARHLFSKLCHKEPEKRYTAKQAMSHPWITRKFDDEIPMSSSEQMKAFVDGQTLGRLMKITYLMIGLMENREQNAVKKGYQDKVDKCIESRKLSVIPKDSPEDDINSLIRHFSMEQQALAKKPPLHPKLNKEETDSKGSGKADKPFSDSFNQSGLTDSSNMVNSEDICEIGTRSRATSNIGPSKFKAQVGQLSDQGSDAPLNTDQDAPKSQLSNEAGSSKPAIETSTQNDDESQNAADLMNPNDEIMDKRKKVLIKIKRFNTHLAGNNRNHQKAVDKSYRSSSNESRGSDSTSPAPQIEMRKKFMLNLKPLESNKIIKSVDTHPKKTILKQYKKTSTQTKELQPQEETPRTENAGTPQDNESVTTFGSDASPHKRDSSEGKGKKKKKSQTSHIAQQTSTSFGFMNTLGRRRGKSDVTSVKPVKPLASQTQQRYSHKTPVKAIQESRDRSNDSNASGTGSQAGGSFRTDQFKISIKNQAILDLPCDSNSNSSKIDNSLSPIKRKGSNSSIQYLQTMALKSNSSSKQDFSMSPKKRNSSMLEMGVGGANKSMSSGQDFSQSPSKRNSSLIEISKLDKAFDSTFQHAATFDKTTSKTYNREPNSAKIVKKKVVVAEKRYSTPSSAVFRTYDETKSRENLFSKLPEIRDNKGRSRSNVKIRNTSNRPVNRNNSSMNSGLGLVKI